jgi:hypothetical protein
MSSNTQKLRVIRSRTDHDLLTLIQRELDRGLALVNVAVTRNSPLFAQAQKAHETAMTLLPKVSGLDDHDRQRIDGKVTELRTRLQQVPDYAVRSYTAPVAS